MLIVSRDKTGSVRVYRGALADRLMHAVPYCDVKGRAAVRIGGKHVKWLHLESSQGNHWCVAREEQIPDALAISAFYSIVDGRTKPQEDHAASS